MNVLLLQLDGKLPNLALMRIAHWHTERGHDVELRRAGNARAVSPRFGDPVWDRVYGSLIFESTRGLAEYAMKYYPTIELGGTGWDLRVTLADVGIDEGPYGLGYRHYPKFRSAIGFSQRGCRLSCDFCVVPRKEGKARSVASIRELHAMRLDTKPRGGWPNAPEIMLLDNDFFGNPNWVDVHDELRGYKYTINDGVTLRASAYKVDLTQGINARALNDETALAMSQLDYRASNMRDRRIYTAWDNIGHERPLMRGLELLAKYGVKPDHIMVYMLIGHRDSHEDREYRRSQIRAFGARPYPMPLVRTPELVGFQRWVVGAYDKRVPWDKWAGARYSPRRLGAGGHALGGLGRQGSLPLYEGP